MCCCYNNYETTFSPMPILLWALNISNFSQSLLVKRILIICGFTFPQLILLWSLVCIFSFSVTVSLQCKILKCNSEFWASTSNSGPEEEFCTALRAYNSCVRRTARTCRGDLAYHSAQHGIEDLMSQHNCSKEGPTSQPRARTPLPPPPPPLLPDSQEHSDGPEVCHYERSLTRNTSPPNYTHCGFFGDPHLRTFGDDFQTCKVEGAWPLIHNKYLSVQVTNTPVVPGSLATATSKVGIFYLLTISNKSATQNPKTCKYFTALDLKKTHF